MGLRPEPVVSHADELLGDLDARVPSNRGLRFATGFEPLDDALGGGIGLHELTVIGGAAGAGKTIAALQWARSIAMAGRPVIYTSFQHSSAHLLRRLLALEIGSLARPDEAATARRLQNIAQEVVIGAAPLRALLAEPLGEEAYGRIRSYGAALQLVAGSAATTGLPEIARLIDTHAGRGSALFVDPFDRIQSDSTDENRVAELAGSEGPGAASRRRRRRRRVRRLLGSDCVAAETPPPLGGNRHRGVRRLGRDGQSPPAPRAFGRPSHLGIVTAPHGLQHCQAPRRSDRPPPGVRRRAGTLPIRPEWIVPHGRTRRSLCSRTGSTLHLSCLDD